MEQPRKIRCTNRGSLGVTQSAMGRGALGGLGLALAAALAVVALQRRGGAAVSLVAAAADGATIVVSNADYGAVAPAKLYPFAYIAEAHRESTVALASGDDGGAWAATYATSPLGEAVGLALGADAPAAHGYVVASAAASLTFVCTMAGGRYAVANDVGSFDVYCKYFELALAAVDPAMGGAPYWDYTLDDAAYGRDWAANSSVFSAAFFGKFADDESYDAAANGFGASLPLAAQGALGFDRWPEANAWGTLTEAWNTDGADRAAVRSSCGLETEARLPGCAALRGALAAKTTTALRARVEYDLHAELHTAVGGSAGCQFPPRSGSGLDLAAFAAAHPEAAPALENVVLNLNLFWRGLFNDTKLNPAYPITCPRPGDCVRGATAEADCACTCAKLDAKLANASGDPSAEYELAYAAVDSTLLFELAAGGSEGTRVSDFIAYEAGTPPRWRWLDRDGAPLRDGADSALTTVFAKLVFHPAAAAAFTGPLAAPNDPLFWPSHSLADRVWAQARLSGLNETWDYDTAEDADRAIPSGCWGFARDAKLPFYDLFGEHSRADYHAVSYESHLARLRDLVTGRDGAQGGYTNAELHEKLNPRNVHLPFVYEDFEWAHCGLGG
ncbi:hypothetical protein JL722_13209 [Aureococcus anophagefferens]|nr:hypothetical protein JL722_13209 [Aureococcus anophagefferens]